MKSVFFKSRKFILCMFDLLCFFVVNSVYVLGVVLDESLEVRDPAKFLTNFVVLAALIFTFRIVSGFYKNVWRYVHTKVHRIILAFFSL